MKATKGSKEKEAVKTEVELSAIEKIRKLLEFSVENGATEGEVENAIKLAQRLMMKHNLEQKDIEITSKDINVTVVPSTWTGRTIMVETRAFENRLLTLFGKMYSCMIIIKRSPITKTDSYEVVGLPEDRKIVVDLYNSILPQVRTLSRKRYKESDKSLSEFKFTTSYQSGFVEGMREKMTADRATFGKASERKDFELIVVKKETLVTEWVANNMNIKKGKSKPVEIDPATFEKGKEDGSEKGLNKQLGK